MRLSSNGEPARSGHVFRAGIQEKADVPVGLSILVDLRSPFRRVEFMVLNLRPRDFIKSLIAVRP